MSLVCNALHFAAHYAADPERGAVAARPILAGEPVAVLVYWEWDARIPVAASSIAVRHVEGDGATCVLERRVDDVQRLRARRPLEPGDAITLDYRRAPWWLPWPSRVALPPRRHVLTRVGVVHGVGAVAGVPLCPGDVVGVVIEFRYWLLPVITRDLGRYVNHAARPSMQLLWRDGAWLGVAARALAVGDELTLDYAALPSYCARPAAHYS